MQFNTIHHFWFTELTEKQQFAKDAALEALIAQRFGGITINSASAHSISVGQFDDDGF